MLESPYPSPSKGLAMPDYLGHYNEITCFSSAYFTRMHAGRWVSSLSHYYNYKVVIIILLAITIMDFDRASVAVDRVADALSVVNRTLDT